MPITLSAFLHTLNSQHVADFGALLCSSFLLSFRLFYAMSLPIAHKELIQSVACVLADKRYVKRWFGLDALSEFCDAFAPAGFLINRSTASNAFKISGGLFYAEFPFSDQLRSELNCEADQLILAVRRLRKPDFGKGGYFTVVGCFERDKVPDEDAARKAYLGVKAGRSSTRSVERIDLPPRILTELISYIHRPGKKYFMTEVERPSTPK